jgi:hypothetical protein
MTPYVLAVAAAKLLVVLVAFLIEVAGFDLGSSHGTGVAIATIIAGPAWFAHSVNRPMTRRERLRFASGVTLLDLGLSIIALVFAALLSGQPLTAQSIELTLSGGKEVAFDPALLLVVGFTEILTFGAAYLFGWSFTRKLPRKRDPDRATTRNSNGG